MNNARIASIFALGIVALTMMFVYKPLQAQSESIMTVLSSRDDLSTLTAALEASGLAEALSDPEIAITLFAPTNAAFDFSQDALEALLLDSDTLLQILPYHAVQQPLMGTDLSGNLPTLAISMLGADLTATTTGIGKTMVNGAYVVEADIMAGGSVIHIIDSVLVPPELRETIISPRIRIAQNRELGRAFVQDLLQAPTFAQAQTVGEAIVAEDYIQHNPLVAQGRAGLLGFLEVMPTFFSETRFTLKDVVASEDTVVARWTWSGTHTGNFLGYEATNNDFNMGVIDIWTVEDGVLYEHWDEIGWSYALAQLGIYQFPPEPIGPVQGYPSDN